jgi:hypothetical protein
MSTWQLDVVALYLRLQSTIMKMFGVGYLNGFVRDD